MARVTGPLFSLSARGTIGDCITYSVWKGIEYVRQWFTPHNPQSAAQTNIRGIFAMGVQGWQNILTGAQRTAWDDDANRPQGMSGFNYYMREYIEAMLAGTTPPVAPP